MALPVRMQERLDAFEDQLTSFENMLEHLMFAAKKENVAQLSPLEQAKLHALLAYTMNALYFSTLASQRCVRCAWAQVLTGATVAALSLMTTHFATLLPHSVPKDAGRGAERSPRAGSNCAQRVWQWCCTHHTAYHPCLLRVCSKK